MNKKLTFIRWLWVDVCAGYECECGNKDLQAEFSMNDFNSYLGSTNETKKAVIEVKCEKCKRTYKVLLKLEELE
ncbi:MAG: hypothetical protein ACTSUK_05670 [Promethearchaeota archaeon]